MHDEPDRSQVVDKARQLAELISWIIYDDRRLGLLDRCERLEGQVADGKEAALARHGGGWELQIENSPARVLTGFEDVLRTITSTHFTPERVVVIPRFAGLLFQAAVEQTQAGLANYLQYQSAKHKAREEKTGDLDGPEFFAMVLGIPIGGPIEAALGMSSLDESLRDSIAGIILAVSAAEAQINEWVTALGGWIEDEDREALVRKMRLLAVKAGRELDVGRDPFQRLHECVAFRNDLVHPKQKEEELVASERPAPGRDLSHQARETCYLVRTSLIVLADLLGVVRPEYLAYCPPGDFRDDQSWSTAVVMTGVRDDPDFPKART